MFLVLSTCLLRVWLVIGGGNATDLLAHLPQSPMNSVIIIVAQLLLQRLVFFVRLGCEITVNGRIITNRAKTKKLLFNTI